MAFGTVGFACEVPASFIDVLQYEHASIWEALGVYCRERHGVRLFHALRDSIVEPDLEGSLWAIWELSEVIDFEWSFQRWETS